MISNPLTMPADSGSDSAAAGGGDPQAQLLERMKTEFLAAQQRRRARTPRVPARPDDTDNGPLLAGPADGSPAGIAAVRP